MLEVSSYKQVEAAHYLLQEMPCFVKGTLSTSSGSSLTFQTG